MQMWPVVRRTYLRDRWPVHRHPSRDPATFGSRRSRPWRPDLGSVLRQGRTLGRTAPS